MVIEQLVHRGIRDPRVLGAMGTVPRHRFVDPALAADAYDDRPLAIGYGQTISQPYMVARATELAEPHAQDRALEVGAGSGYQTAVLAELCSQVFAIEIVPALAERAARPAWCGPAPARCASAGSGHPRRRRCPACRARGGQPAC